MVNIMYILVTEKTKDIGIMKAIGAKTSDVIKIFLVQAGSFGFLAGIIGTGYGTLIIIALESFIKPQFSFFKIIYNPATYIILICASTAFSCLSGFLPSRKASVINVVDAIRK